MSAWVAENQRALADELDRIAARLEAASAGEPWSGDDEPRAHPDAVDRVVLAFGLSPFERDLLLLCAGAELETRIAGLCGDGAPGLPSFGLALAALADPHWSAITPDAQGKKTQSHADPEARRHGIPIVRQPSDHRRRTGSGIRGGCVMMSFPSGHLRNRILGGLAMDLAIGRIRS